MTLWSAWFPDIAPHVPGCPTAIIIHELRRSAQEFFRRTQAWREVQFFPVAALQSDVSILPDDKTLDLVRIRTVYFDKKRLVPTTYETLSQLFTDQFLSHTATYPGEYYALEPGVLNLYPTPINAAVDGLTVMMAVTPGESSTGLPDSIALKYRDTVIAGAKARLMVYPNKPWTNMDMAGVYSQKFATEADKFTADAARSFSNARIPARPTWC